MRIRAAGAHGGDAGSVGGGCRSAQAARSVLARRGQERSNAVGLSAWLAACTGRKWLMGQLSGWARARLQWLGPDYSG
jgi:hypothetical protein